MLSLLADEVPLGWRKYVQTHIHTPSYSLILRFHFAYNYRSGMPLVTIGRPDAFSCLLLSPSCAQRRLVGGVGKLIRSDMSLVDIQLFGSWAIIEYCCVCAQYRFSLSSNSFSGESIEILLFRALDQFQTG